LAKLAGAANLNAELTAIHNSVEAAIKKFDARQPWLVASDLAAGMRVLRTLYGKVKNAALEETNKDHLRFLFGNKEAEFNEAMNKVLGLTMEVLVDPARTSRRPAGVFPIARNFQRGDSGAEVFAHGQRRQPQPGANPAGQTAISSAAQLARSKF
jgi:hypothetical protein